MHFIDRRGRSSSILKELLQELPASMMRGTSQQFTWRMGETDVNLTYQSFQERGTVFIESAR